MGKILAEISQWLHVTGVQLIINQVSHEYDTIEVLSFCPFYGIKVTAVQKGFSKMIQNNQRERTGQQTYLVSQHSTTDWQQKVQIHLRFRMTLGFGNSRCN